MQTRMIKEERERLEIFWFKELKNILEDNISPIDIIYYINIYILCYILIY